MNYTSFYLGENPSFEITFDFNYIVFSHIFLIFDSNNQTDEYIKSNNNEIESHQWVSLKFFDETNSINHKNNNEFIREVNHSTKLFSLKMKGLITKLMLNKDENFLVYGLTLRKILHLLNTNKIVYDYKEKFTTENTYYLKYLTIYILLLKTIKSPKLLFDFIIYMIIFSTTIFTIKVYKNLQ